MKNNSAGFWLLALIILLYGAYNIAGQFAHPATACFNNNMWWSDEKCLALAKG